eukprot:59551-Prorocentrum_minimum.AAC.3
MSALRISGLFWIISATSTSVADGPSTQTVSQSVSQSYSRGLLLFLWGRRAEGTRPARSYQDTVLSATYGVHKRASESMEFDRRGSHVPHCALASDETEISNAGENANRGEGDGLCHHIAVEALERGSASIH